MNEESVTGMKTLSILIELRLTITLELVSLFKTPLKTQYTVVPLT